MTMLSRASARETPCTPPPDAAALQKVIDNPDTGSIKRRALRRIAAGIKTIGPSGPPEPRLPETSPGPDGFDLACIAIRPVVEGEVTEIDRHIGAVEARLARIGQDVRSFEAQELRSEQDALAALRAEVAADLQRPITLDRDGRPITDQMRAFVRLRTKETRESLWRNAEKAAAEGDHRRARQLRHDALRARHLAEHEAGIRPSLRGYSFPG